MAQYFDWLVCVIYVILNLYKITPFTFCPQPLIHWLIECDYSPRPYQTSNLNHSKKIWFVCVKYVIFDWYEIAPAIDSLVDRTQLYPKSVTDIKPSGFAQSNTASTHTRAHLCLCPMGCQEMRCTRSHVIQYIALTNARGRSQCE